MALVTDREAPRDIPSADSLRDIPDDLLGGPPPPAYLRFGQTPCAVENPPNTEDDDVRVYMVRARCTGEHGPIKRTDGAIRYARDMAIQAIWLPGQPEPVPTKTKAELDAEAEAEAAENQPALPGFDGEPDEEPSGLDEFDPEFSHNGDA